jgi:hypothetical protein
MTQKHDMTTPKMTRVTVRVPKTTLDQINDWVDTLGVRRSHFLGIALVAGVRSLMRASALEMSLSSEGSLQSDTDAPVKEPAQQTAKLDSIDFDGLNHVVKALKVEVASLQAEVTDLREQLRTQQDGKKRS